MQIRSYRRTFNEGVIDMIQLHGSEDDGYIKKLKGMIRSDRHSGQAYTGPVIKHSQ
ncbi:MAG: hypothetical protein V8Q42_11800 [Anaerovoracaceae bacterium]